MVPGAAAVRLLNGKAEADGSDSVGSNVVGFDGVGPGNCAKDCDCDCERKDCPLGG